MFQQNTIRTTIKQFLTAYRQEGKSLSTTEKYGYHLGRMAAWFAERGITQIGEIRREHLWEWGADSYETKCARTGKVWSQAMVRQGIAAARAFLKWCEEEKLVTGLADALKLPKQKKRIQRTLAVDEIQKLLDACPDTPKGIRDAAILSLMVDSGLRATEACNVKVKDVHFNVNVMGVVKINLFTVVVKGGDEELGYFGDATADRLKLWLETRQKLVKNGVETLFISLGGIKPRTGG